MNVLESHLLQIKIAQDDSYSLLKTSQVISDELSKSKIKVTSEEIVSQGEKFHKSEDCKWLIAAIEEKDKILENGKCIVVDFVRNPKQVLALRNEVRWKVIHIHLYCDKAASKDRCLKKHSLPKFIGLTEKI